MINVRKHFNASHVTHLGGRGKVRLRLPFDPLLRNEVSRSVRDEKSGMQTVVSCLFWHASANGGKGKWSNAGITHVKTDLGDPRNGTGAFVECLTDHLSIFSASEVPADCDGTPLGLKLRDECGVCGGDNSLCSGCDGAPNTGRLKHCSGHGKCAGSKCACDAYYFGIMCQVYCDGAVNCSGHGQCVVTSQGLSMVTQTACKCDPGYRVASMEIGAFPPPSCVKIEKEAGGFGGNISAEIFFALVAGVPGLCLCCSCLLFWCCISRTQAKRVRAMRAEVDRYLESHAQANRKLEPQEVEVDLCMPIGPGTFYTAPAHSDEAPLRVTTSDLKRIRDNMSEHVALREVEPAQSQDERAVTKGLGLVSTAGDSDSTSDSENGDEGSRAERMRKIRLMRQTVARSVTGGRGPRACVSDTTDVDVIV